MGSRDAGFLLLGLLFGLLTRSAVFGLSGILVRLWKRYRMGPRLRLWRRHRFFYRLAKPTSWLLVKMPREFYDDLLSLGVTPLALVVVHRDYTNLYEFIRGLESKPRKRRAK